jgi:hypothetical protein
MCMFSFDFGIKFKKYNYSVCCEIANEKKEALCGGKDEGKKINQSVGESAFILDSWKNCIVMQYYM